MLLLFGSTFPLSHSSNGQLTDSLDTAIFNSLLKSEKELSINEKITKVIEWNRYDIAKNEIFNEKLDWVNKLCFHLKLIFNFLKFSSNRIQTLTSRMIKCKLLLKKTNINL